LLNIDFLQASGLDGHSLSLFAQVDLWLARVWSELRRSLSCCSNRLGAITSEHRGTRARYVLARDPPLDLFHAARNCRRPQILDADVAILEEDESWVSGGAFSAERHDLVMGK
jgi:hypothetical protein